MKFDAFREYAEKKDDLDKQAHILYRDLVINEFGLLDGDGYPTVHALRLISKWHYSDPKGWFEFIKSLWQFHDFGWHESEHPHEYIDGKTVYRYDISTAGWSGNESIIRAMEENDSIWFLVWVQSRRGGHYIFEMYHEI